MNSSSVLIFYVVIVGAVMLLMSSRGRKRRAAQAGQIRNATEVGAEVRTIGGLIGEVVEVTDEHVVIETTPGVRLKFVKSAIAGVVPPASEYDDEDSEEDADADSDEGADSDEDAAVKAEGSVDAADVQDEAAPVKS